DPPFPDSRPKLHLIWDSLHGQGKYDDMDFYEAEGLRNDPRFSREKMKDALAVTDFMAWANESHELAVRYAYLDGKLKGATTREARDAQRENLELEAQRDARRDVSRDGQSPASRSSDGQPPREGQPRERRLGPRATGSKIP